MSIINDKQDLQSLARGGKILASVLNKIKQNIKIGSNLLDIDSAIETEITKNGATPSFKGFEGYPNASCLSINSEVVHSIPKDYILKSGDVLGIDVGLWYKGICVDSAITISVGKTDPKINKLIKITRQSLIETIQIIKPGITVGDIGYHIQRYADENNFGLVKNLTGHGVGYKVHDDPSIPNFGNQGEGVIIKPNMVLAIEPMFTLGSGEIRTDSDGWGIKTIDGSIAAQFEHTILVTKTKNIIITI